MGRSKFHPPGFGGERPDPEQVKKEGWHEFGLFAVRLDDKQLDWPERKFIELIGNRLYGERKDKNVATEPA